MEETPGTAGAAAAWLMTRMMATAVNALEVEDPATDRVASGLERPNEKDDGTLHSLPASLLRH